MFAPLSDRSCRLLWLSRSASAAGDALMPLALPFAVLAVDSSASALGTVLGVFWGARLACTLLGGVVADRYPRRAVMLSCDAVRAAVEVTAAALLLTHHMTIPILLGVAAVFGAAAAFFAPAADGLVAQVVPADKLQATNALLTFSQNSANVVGPALAGVLVAVTTPGVVFMVDAATFVVSAVLLTRLRVARHPPAGATPFLRDLRVGFREVVARAWLRAPILGFAISNFCLAAFLVLGPVIARERLGGARDWGVILSCGALGGIAGSLLSAYWRPRRPVSAAFAVLAAVGVPLLALARPWPALGIAAAWTGAMASIAAGNTFWQTALQSRIPNATFARVRSYDHLVSFAFMPIGMVAFPWLAKHGGAGASLISAGLVIVTTSLAVSMLPAVRGVVREPTN